MVLTIMRNANPDRVEAWVSDYGITHPVLIDTGGGYGDIGLQLSLHGGTPSNHLVAPDAVYSRREHRPTEGELREILGVESD